MPTHSPQRARGAAATGPEGVKQRTDFSIHVPDVQKAKEEDLGEVPGGVKMGVV